MKVRDTSRGRMYAVSSNPGCTVINGDMAVDVPAGGQSVILALDKKLIIEGDDNAKFVEVRWGTNAAVGSRSIPWMGAVVDGLISIVGLDKFDINYIPAENKLVVHTDRASDELSEEVTELLTSVVPQDVEVVQYNHHIEVNWRDINKYAECKTRSDFLAVNPDYLNDLTSDGEWVYPTDSMRSGNGIFFSGWGVTPEFKFYAKKVTGRTLVTEMSGYYFPVMPQCTHVEFDAPNVTHMRGQWLADSTKVKYVRLYAPKLKEIYSMLWLRNNAQIEYDGELPSLSKCNNFTAGCYLSLGSAIRVLNSLPAYTSGTHNIGSFGVHIDGQTDEEVQAAISNAEAKGWTLTVQWNGTPTAQASTFNMGQLIYAKVDEYELPDGTTEQYLDWGHYVTNWEERGYEQFRSLESAYEYFNLPMPEVETEEELQIEEIENA